VSERRGWIDDCTAKHTWNCDHVWQLSTAPNYAKFDPAFSAGCIECGRRYSKRELMDREFPVLYTKGGIVCPKCQRGDG
jgi:hypothetical protein